MGEVRLQGRTSSMNKTAKSILPALTISYYGDSELQTPSNTSFLLHLFYLHAMWVILISSILVNSGCVYCSFARPFLAFVSSGQRVRVQGARYKPINIAVHREPILRACVFHHTDTFYRELLAGVDTAITDSCVLAFKLMMTISVHCL